MDGDVNDGEASPVAIGNPLGDLQSLTANGLLVLVEHRIAETPTNNLSHSGLCGLGDDVIGAYVVEQVLLWATDAILNRKLHVDHVLVFGQHERVSALTAALTTEADRGLTQLGNIHHLMGLDGVGQPPFKASAGGVLVLTKPQHQAGLALLDNVKA